MKIFVTNTKRISEHLKNFNKKFEVFGSQFGLIPVGGRDTWIVTEEDSCHCAIPYHKNNALEFSTAENNNGSLSFNLSPAKYPIAKLFELGLLDEVEFDSFINKTQGSRRQENYKLLVKTLAENGLVEGENF